MVVWPQVIDKSSTCHVFAIQSYQIVLFLWLNKMVLFLWLNQRNSLVRFSNKQMLKAVDCSVFIFIKLYSGINCRPQVEDWTHYNKNSYQIAPCQLTPPHCILNKKSYSLGANKLGQFFSKEIIEEALIA